MLCLNFNRILKSVLLQLMLNIGYEFCSYKIVLAIGAIFGGVRGAYLILIVSCSHPIAPPMILTITLIVNIIHKIT